jgi:hypothetical protein
MPIYTASTTELDKTTTHPGPEHSNAVSSLARHNQVEDLAGHKDDLLDVLALQPQQQQGSQLLMKALQKSCTPQSAVTHTAWSDPFC